jgi:hypothetical protein
VTKAAPVEGAETFWTRVVGSRRRFPRCLSKLPRIAPRCLLSRASLLVRFPVGKGGGSMIRGFTKTPTNGYGGGWYGVGLTVAGERRLLRGAAGAN